MKLMHVFLEDENKDRLAHIKYWFGLCKNDDEQYNDEDGSYIVCYCGARIVPLEYEDEEISVAAVWHKKEYWK